MEWALTPLHTLRCLVGAVLSRSVEGPTEGVVAAAAVGEALVLCRRNRYTSGDALHEESREALEVHQPSMSLSRSYSDNLATSC